MKTQSYINNHKNYMQAKQELEEQKNARSSPGLNNRSLSINALTGHPYEVVNG